MKKKSSVFSIMLIMGILMMTSCSAYQDVSYEGIHKSKDNSLHIVSLSELESICAEVSTLYESNEAVRQSTRSEEDKVQAMAYTSQQISNAMMPLQVSGAAYRDAVLYNQASIELELYSSIQSPLDEEEIQFLNNLSEEELTMLGMQLSVFSTVLDTYINETIDDSVTLEIASNKYVDCFLKVTGVATIGGIASNLQDLLDGKFSMQNLKNALTGNSYVAARTFMQFLKAMGIRYLGVIGVGYMIYEYHECVTS